MKCGIFHIVGQSNSQVDLNLVTRRTIIWQHDVPMAKLYFYLKMKVTNISDVAGILLHKILYQCAHVCLNL